MHLNILQFDFAGTNTADLNSLINISLLDSKYLNNLHHLFFQQLIDSKINIVLLNLGEL